MSRATRVGAVVIGRNEGERLIRCLSSLGGDMPVVYVDSGSTDGSVEAAASMGAHVVELDISCGFTAARARNAGFAALRLRAPDLRYVQFVDGDCEVLPGWVDGAADFLDRHAQAAVACGRRYERHPDASIYSRMSDNEWNTPVGEAEACGGDALMRVSAFTSVGGFADDQVANEEPELCGRLRSSGFTVWRLDLPMTMHDVGITSIRQFYNRCRRSGVGLAQCLVDRRRAIDWGGRTIVVRALAWAVALPVGIALLVAAAGPAGFAAVLVYPAQVLRHAFADQQRVGGSLLDRLKAAAIAMVGKFGEAQGAIEYVARRCAGNPIRNIFYK